MLLTGKYIKLSLYALTATFLLSGCYTQLQFSEPDQNTQQSYYDRNGTQEEGISADKIKERPRVGLQANGALDDTSYAVGYIDGWKESSYHYTDYNTRNYWDSFYSWNRYPRFNMHDSYYSRFSMGFHDPFFFDRYPVYQFGFSFGYSSNPHYYMASRRYYDPYRTGFGFGSYYSGYPSYFGWSGTGVVVSDKDKIDRPRGSGITRAAPTPGLSNSSSGGGAVSHEKTSNWDRLRNAIERRLTPRNGSSGYDTPRSSSSTRSYDPSGSGTRRSSGTSVGRSRSSSSGSSGNTRSSSGSSSSGSRNDSPRSSGTDRSSGDNSRSDGDSRN